MYSVLLVSLLAPLAFAVPVIPEIELVPRAINPAFAEDAKSLWGYGEHEKRAINPAFAEDAKSLWGYSDNNKRAENPGHTHAAESYWGNGEIDGGGHGPESLGSAGPVLPLYRDSPEEAILPVKRSIPFSDLPLLPNGWIDYSAKYTAPSAVNPLYANLTGHEVYRRAASGPLYGSSGRPAMEDVHQTTNPDCGFASVMAAVAYCNPDWIGSKTQYSGAFADVNSATVSLNDLKNGQKHDITIAHSDTARNSDIDPATGVWWPGLFDHAAVQIGMNNRNGALGPVAVWHSMRVITGFEALAHEGMTPDEMFQLGQRGSSEKTPVVLQTTNETRTLVGNHAYAVIGASGAGGDRKLHLYNPWGMAVDIAPETAKGDTYVMWSLKDYNTFTGSSSGAVPAGADGGAVELQPTSSKVQAQTSSVQRHRRPRPTPIDVGIDVKPAPDGNGQKADDAVVIVTEVVTVTVVA